MSILLAAVLETLAFFHGYVTVYAHGERSSGSGYSQDLTDPEFVNRFHLGGPGRLLEDGTWWTYVLVKMEPSGSMIIVADGLFSLRIVPFDEDVRSQAAKAAPGWEIRWQKLTVKRQGRQAEILIEEPK